MIQVRHAAQRGSTQLDWLDSRHSFAFGDYQDPAHRGFGPLRVLNEDRVAPGGGFPTHGHRDMEILTWVLGGALAHRDSLGSGTVIRPGELQRMSAGTGIRHSEFNASADAPVHFLQIWIEPDRSGLEPGYAQQAFDDAQMREQLRLVASRDGRDGTVSLNRDADVYAARISAGRAVQHRLTEGRRAWLQVARGRVSVDRTPLAEGDGAAISGSVSGTVSGTVSDNGSIRIDAESDAEVLLFDLA